MKYTGRSPEYCKNRLLEKMTELRNILGHAQHDIEHDTDGLTEPFIESGTIQWYGQEIDMLYEYLRELTKGARS